MRLPRLAYGLAAAVLAGALPAPASATFHEVSVREVYPGSVAETDAEYVELQMWAVGQNIVQGHSLKAFDASGNLVATTTFSHNLANGASQSTMLLATPAAESRFGVGADASMAPGQLDPGGGAVCWESLDCVSWGNFKGTLPSPAGSPAGAIPDGMALRRTIAPGCPTLLEPTDDRDDSAADLVPVFPSPRPNAVAPTESRCASEGGGQGAGPGGGGAANIAGPPQTILRGRPSRRTRDRTPTFRFAADAGGASFECRLDRKPFRPCHSPHTSRRLRLGRHRFAVRARDDSGAVDPTPATFAFRVIAPR